MSEPFDDDGADPDIMAIQSWDAHERAEAAEAAARQATTRVRIATAALTVAVEAAGAPLDMVADRALMLMRECAPLACAPPRLAAGGMGFSAELAAAMEPSANDERGARPSVSRRKRAPLSADNRTRSAI